ncbi:MAG: cytochrome c [Chitinophagaceae bacterium]|nr:cytochrome c [Chitinophagaceae bacterium]
MKNTLTVISIMTFAFLLYNCTGTKKATAAAPVLSTWNSNVQTVIMANCSPCHIPVKGGNKKAYDNYANTKSDIDEIIRRIELNPTDRGFMPFKHPKLSDSTIAVFKQWKTDGLIEN